MFCRVTDMHDKEVINLSDGTRLGCVDDVEIDTGSAQLVSIVLYGRNRLLGLGRREEDLVIGWREIEVIGEDTILVRLPAPPPSPALPPAEVPTRGHRKEKILKNIFR